MSGRAVREMVQESWALANQGFSQHPRYEPPFGPEIARRCGGIPVVAGFKVLLEITLLSNKPCFHRPLCRVSRRRNESRISMGSRPILLAPNL